MVNTEPVNIVTLRRSKSLVNIAYEEQKVIFSLPEGYTDACAPEIQNIDCVWYTYFTMTNSGKPGRRMHAIRCTDTDPMTGTWSYVGQISSQQTGIWAFGWTA